MLRKTARQVQGGDTEVKRNSVPALACPSRRRAQVVYSSSVRAGVRRVSHAEVASADWLEDESIIWKGANSKRKADGVA